jgi:hypothetical protein
MVVPAFSQSGLIQKSRLPLSWVKQSSQDKWSFIVGTTGPYKVSVSLVRIQEEAQGRKLASAQAPSPVFYTVEYVKKDVQKVSDEQLKQSQLMVLIAAP